MVRIRSCQVPTSWQKEEAEEEEEQESEIKEGEGGEEEEEGGVAPLLQSRDPHLADKHQNSHYINNTSK